METALLVTIAIFLLGVVFQSGRLSEKVDSLEEWRRDVATDIKSIRTATDRLESVLSREDR